MDKSAAVDRAHVLSLLQHLLGGTALGSLAGAGYTFLVPRETGNVQRRYLRNMLIGGGIGALEGGALYAAEPPIKNILKTDEILDKYLSSGFRVEKSVWDRDLIGSILLGSLLGGAGGAVYDLANAKRLEEIKGQSGGVRSFRWPLIGALLGGTLGGAAGVGLWPKSKGPGYRLPLFVV